MTFAKKLAGSTIGQPARRVLAAYRVALRRAERFVVDDAAVRLVCDLSHENRLDAWSFLARLPYDPVFFELNLHTKVAHFASKGTLRGPFNPAEVSPRVGYLFYRDTDDIANPRWVVNVFYHLNGENSDPVPGMFSYVFDPEGTSYNPVRGSLRWAAPTLSLRPGFPRVPARIADLDGLSAEVDPEYILGGDLCASGDPDAPVTGAEWLVSRAAAIVDPFWAAHLADRFRNDQPRTNNLFASQVLEESGIIRWLVTLLATVNGLPRDVRPVVRRPGTRAVGMNVLPYLQHHHLNLDVPHDDRVVWATRHLDRALCNSRRPWHRVIGHWRVIERGRSTHLCRHAPTMVENNVGMCERCQLLIRWVEYPNGRGDPTVGIVEHTEYRVRGRRVPATVEVNHG